ncbi:hypothetical protein JHK87_017797 [Glycine soja]|nr:hypothetical protein JHK87_017797 [Glycine soja]
MSPVVTTSNSLVGKEGVGAPSELLCKTLYTWEEVVLLHLAMEWEGLVVKDSSVLETLDALFQVASVWDQADLLCVKEKKR